MRIANAPCSWGILEFDGLDGETADCRRFLHELREAGYVGTELGDWGFMPTDPDELRALLGEFDLPLLGAFVPVALSHPAAHAAGREQALQTARLLAAVNQDAFIVLADDNGSDATRTQWAGRIEPHHGLTGDQWTAFARGAEAIAHAVRVETGLRTVFHHHCAGFVETPHEVDELLARTDPALLGLCFDTGHWTFGGGDAVAGLRRYAERIWHVHFKDCSADVAASARANGWSYFDSVKNGVFCELGRGSVAFGDVIATLREFAYDGWIVVEQDVLPGMGTPRQSAMRNREALARHGL